MPSARRWRTTITGWIYSVKKMRVMQNIKKEEEKWYKVSCEILLLLLYIVRKLRIIVGAVSGKLVRNEQAKW